MYRTWYIFVRIMSAGSYLLMSKKCSKHVEAVNQNKLEVNNASCWSYYTDLTAHCHILEYNDLHTVLNSGMWCIVMGNVCLFLSLSICFCYTFPIQNEPCPHSTICTFFTQKQVRNLTYYSYSNILCTELIEYSNGKQQNCLLYWHNLNVTINASRAVDRCSHIF
jgi:hypothetical protein